MTRQIDPEFARRVAILHYTASPAIGGIESLMARQCTVLKRLGHEAVLVVGRGSGPAGSETIQVPAMDPSNHLVQHSRHEFGVSPPTRDHPAVRHLANRLESALDRCTDCWIHNALTVSLNPFLTSALEVLIERRPNLRWVAWCADLSSVSRFVPPHGVGRSSFPPSIADSVHWVAISDTRRRELSAAVDIPAHQIRVVPPPLELLTWMGVGSQTRVVADTTNLLESDLVVLVPAKALPHKCLDRAVGVAAVLARHTPRVRVLHTAASSPHEPGLSLQIRDRLRLAIQSAGLERAVVLLPDLLREEPGDRTVRELMQLSDVVFLPSVEEGFGMPLLEAAACRVPVVCTDIPVFREVAGNSALYFQVDWDDEQLAALILSASQVTGASQRRASAASMQRFEADLQEILRVTT